MRKSNAPQKNGIKKGRDFGSKPLNTKQAAKRLIAYLKPHWIYVLMLTLFAAFSAMFNIFIPSVLKEATNEIYYNFNNFNFDLVLNVLIKCAILYGLSALFMLFSGLSSAELTAKVVYRMRKDVKEKLTRLPLKYYDENSTGEILSRVTNDVDTISSTLQESISQIISGIVTFIGVLIIMFVKQWILALVSLVAIPFMVIVTGFIAKRSQKYFVKTQATLGILNGHVEECYTGQQVIKLYGKEEEMTKEFDVINDDLNVIQFKAQFISSIIMPCLHIVDNIMYVLLSVVGGLMAGSGMITVGTIQEFLMYKREFTRPITQIAQIVNIIQSTLAASERVFEILDAEEEAKDVQYNGELDKLNMDVKFDNVSFSYNKDTTLIQNLTLDLKQGDSIAIVGPTGAGKTTLVNLLLRFYELTGGKITIDGVSIEDMSRNQLRSLYGMVLQDAWVFSGTIRENVAYGRPDATDEDIINACKEAHIHHYIMTLADGYNTMINEDATNISQGQKQLLTIARAILSNPRILILDEATSNVDTRTEQLIQQAMSNLMADRTSFIIAHRLSTIKNASTILVMNNGAIVEQGNHYELLQAKGEYYKLYKSQFEN